MQSCSRRWKPTGEQSPSLSFAHLAKLMPACHHSRAAGHYPGRECRATAGGGTPQAYIGIAAPDHLTSSANLKQLRCHDVGIAVTPGLVHMIWGVRQSRAPRSHSTVRESRDVTSRRVNVMYQDAQAKPTSTIHERS